MSAASLHNVRANGPTDIRELDREIHETVTKLRSLIRERTTVGVMLLVGDVVEVEKESARPVLVDDGVRDEAG